MRARTLILVALAILLAGATAFLARNYLARKDTEIVQEREAVKVATPSKSVLVAHVDIKRGQILRPEDTSWQIWPEGGLDKNYIVLGGPPIPPRSPESFAGSVARNPIAAGEPITDTRVIAPGSRGFLAAVLRPGMRAISVPVSITSGISGFIFPGDQVDLMLTYSIPAVVLGGTFEHKAVETVLRNIRVIAIDQRMESKPGEAVVAHTATFEVTSKQSEVIALASRIGEMFLTLRSLVPTSQEALAAEQATSETAGQGPPDSPVAATATCTIDSEVSPLLPQVSSGQGGCEVSIVTVTILRGGGTGSSTSTPSGSGGTGSSTSTPSGSGGIGSPTSTPSGKGL
jgi:pilus assembly protein CpaB